MSKRRYTVTLEYTNSISLSVLSHTEAEAKELALEKAMDRPDVVKPRVVECRKEAV